MQTDNYSKYSMFLAVLTMITALAISAVAIYYSVAGLAAIFAAAVIPIIIMGGVLEVAKLVTAVWLHRYWPRAVWWLKGYLSIAVIVLMLITSMGIFGFLSKAHIEQTSLSTEQYAQIETLDEKLIRSETKIARWTEELDRLFKGEDVRIDNLVAREQEEIDKLYNRLEDEKTFARQDADAKIELQNNRLSQAQQRKKQDIQIAQERYSGTSADKSKLDEAVDRATGNELSVASAVQRQIVSINSGLVTQIENIESRYAPQVEQLQQRINSLRDQSNVKTQDIDTRITELESFISQEQNSIAGIREDKVIIEREYRKLEAEVGPVKYIAEFIYGKEADKNLLEEAVRWIIIVIIFVFDPLAVLLLIASQYTFQFRDEDNRNISNDNPSSEPDPTGSVKTNSERNSEDTAEDGRTADGDLSIQQQGSAGEHNSSQSASEPSAVDDAAIVIAESYAQKKTEDNPDISKKKDIKLLEPLIKDDPETSSKETKERIARYEVAEQQVSWQEAKSKWKDLNPNETLKEQKKRYIRGQLEELPWEQFIISENYVQNEEQNETSLWKTLQENKDK